MNTIILCRLVGYSFLMIVTLIEIVMFCIIFNINLETWGRPLAVIITPIIFNASIWGVAIFYHKVKEAHIK